MPLNTIPTSGPITKFPAGTFNEMVRICRRVDRDRVMFGRKPAKDILPPSFKWKNTSGSDAPMGAIVRVKDVMEVDNIVGFIGDKPNTSLALFYGISLTPVADDALGDMVLFDPARAHYDTSDGTPAFGERWGIEPDSWSLRKNRYGFMAVGFPKGSGSKARALFVPIPIRQVVGQFDSDVAAMSEETPGSGTLTLWYFDGTDFVESTITLTAKNFSGAKVPASTFVACDLRDQVWFATQAGEKVTILTNLRYDATSHAWQKKTRDVVAMPLADETDWTTVLSLTAATALSGIADAGDHLTQTTETLYVPQVVSGSTSNVAPIESCDDE